MHNSLWHHHGRYDSQPIRNFTAAFLKKFFVCVFLFVPFFHSHHLQPLRTIHFSLCYTTPVIQWPLTSGIGNQPAFEPLFFFFLVAVRKRQRFIPAVSSVPYLMSLHLHHGARWKCRKARIALFYHMFTPVFIKYWHPFTVTFRRGARDAAHRDTPAETHPLFKKKKRKQLPADKNACYWSDTKEGMQLESDCHSAVL